MHFTPGETNVLCTDLERSLAFYQGVLGYRVVEEEDGAVRLVLGGRFLLLLPVAQKPAALPPYGESAEVTFDLRTEDLEGAASHLIACGVPMEKPWGHGSSYFVIRDPDGLRIEVVG